MTGAPGQLQGLPRALLLLATPVEVLNQHRRLSPYQMPSTESLVVPGMPGTRMPPCGQNGLRVQKE